METVNNIFISQRGHAAKLIYTVKIGCANDKRATWIKFMYGRNYFSSSAFPNIRVHVRRLIKNVEKQIVVAFVLIFPGERLPGFYYPLSFSRVIIVT